MRVQSDQPTRRQLTPAIECLLRIVHKAMDCFDFDLDTLVVLMSVVAASVSGAMRDPKALSDMAQAGMLPDPYHRPVSRRAIAASTGLPRETVRRKIADLVERGYLVQERDGVRTRAGLLGENRHLEFVRTLIEEIRRCGTALERIEREEAA